LEPQLPKEDLETFQYFTSEIFPGIELIAIENNDLKEALRAAFTTHKLEAIFQ